MQSDPLVAERIPPYWIDGSDEHCSGCEHPHSHRSGHTCAACDRDFCVICIRNDEGELLCEPCSEDVRKKQKKVLKKRAKSTVKPAAKTAAKRSSTWRRARSGKV